MHMHENSYISTAGRDGWSELLYVGTSAPMKRHLRVHKSLLFVMCKLYAWPNMICYLYKYMQLVSRVKRLGNQINSWASHEKILTFLVLVIRWAYIFWCLVKRDNESDLFYGRYTLSVVIVVDVVVVVVSVLTILNLHRCWPVVVSDSNDW